ncbi:MAG: relaxase/mobilization nuclease protein [Gammaproteobacteria bacterium]|nr:relaxase/mobilization nuclease protein [Gammaproteobacteria bacterium]
MPKRLVDLGEQTPLLDIASYGRRGPGHRPLTQADLGHISRTVRRAPEVMIKVSGGARTLRGVKSHLEYIWGGPVSTDDLEFVISGSDPPLQSIPHPAAQQCGLPRMQKARA